MALLDVTELTTVWENWTETLKELRNALSENQAELQKAAEKQLHTVDMPQVDHYYNQFDIQLNNISHLKHEIKEFEKMADWDAKQHDGKLSLVSIEQFEKIEDEYASLTHTIQELEIEFKTFLSTHLNAGL